MFYLLVLLSLLFCFLCKYLYLCKYLFLYSVELVIFFVWRLIHRDVFTAPSRAHDRSLSPPIRYTLEYTGHSTTSPEARAVNCNGFQVLIIAIEPRKLKNKTQKPKPKKKRSAADAVDHERTNVPQTFAASYSQMSFDSVVS